MKKEFAVSALVHGCVFVLFMLAGNWIWHWGMSWISFLIAGIIYGVVTACMDLVMENRKKK